MFGVIIFRAGIKQIDSDIDFQSAFQNFYAFKSTNTI